MVITMTTLDLKLPNTSYKITIGKGLLSKAKDCFQLERRVLVVTDAGVPEEYARTVALACKEARTVTLPEGEATKSFERLEFLCREMLDFGMSRKDAVVAVGGGVIGDLAGFAAAVYMRGIDFYKVPTTTLSQLDSSIGGKCAVNLGTTKNIVGAFHQPKGVLIDTDTLKTLDKRQFASGLAEAVKMAVTSSEELFRIFESEEICDANIENVISCALKIKKAVVEEDEKEAGLRKVLNFGHTFGHGIEAANFGKLYHGECVALGMIPMLNKSERPRLLGVLEKLGLPTEFAFDKEAALSYVAHDKKCAGGFLDAVFSDRIGSFRIEKLSISDFENYIRENADNRY